MRISVDPEAALPAYEQIRLQVARLVASGAVEPGARLPTIRQLAADLGLAKGTVERAYLLLESDGLIEARGRQGTVVAKRPRGAGAAVDPSGLREAAELFAVAAVVRGVPVEVALDEVRQAFERLRT
ncbi:MAG: GntR family transcriptional regulator [Acidimicrobiales bacterium]